MPFFGKIGLLGRMSWGRRFLLFLQHRCLVTLNTKIPKKTKWLKYDQMYRYSYRLKKLNRQGRSLNPKVVSWILMIFAHLRGQVLTALCVKSLWNLQSSSKETQPFWTHFSRWPWVTDHDPGSCTFCQHYKVHLSTFFPKRNATFHAAFLLKLSVHVHGCLEKHGKRLRWS